MASKAAIEKGEQRSAKIQEPGALKNVSEGAAGLWANATGFLTDVRAEMRKVVTPTRKEVEATTSVVIITVFIFGLFFFLVDLVFSRALHEVLTRLGGAQ
ncbi:MAG TPA: preprotein translocase subunit SecE [Terracidiphilus sp.]|nr:preprotein translocase subunit SecE [Terracidiphilus sp.]